MTMNDAAAPLNVTLVAELTLSPKMFTSVPAEPLDGAEPPLGLGPASLIQNLISCQMLVAG